MMIEITIDGNRAEVEEGTTILEAARDIGIEIPALCYHKALSPIGSCRLCIVELVEKGKSRVVTSCNYPVRKKIDVRTNSDRILKERKLILELLLARSPDSDVLRKLAKEFGIEKSRFAVDDKKCILCGLCVGVCHEVMKIGAIDFVGRGIEEDVGTPYGLGSDVCIGCGACVSVCPTGAIKLRDEAGERFLEKWKTSLPLRKCRLCGGVVGTEAQIEWLKKEIDLPEEVFDMCSECKRKRYAEEMAVLGHI
jgi:NADH dehydrogenase/NADH:ubiquinone oxidoreductase subunit G